LFASKHANNAARKKFVDSLGAMEAQPNFNPHLKHLPTNLAPCLATSIVQGLTALSGVLCERKKVQEMEQIYNHPRFRTLHTHPPILFTLAFSVYFPLVGRVFHYHSLDRDIIFGLLS